MKKLVIFLELASGQLSENNKDFQRRLVNGGFGYDPLFLPNESSCTFAEIPKEEKAKISHRARALAKLINWLLVYQ